jgi:HEAT repeat protein
VVALEAIRRAGALRSAAAVGPLGKALADAEPTFRLAAAVALGEIGSPGALQWLERALEDGERDVRVATARALGARAHRAALPRLEAAITGKALRESNLTEKMATFEAYGALCGDGGVALLDGLLNGRGFLGRREDPEYRACAALALGRIGTNGAVAALQRGAAEKDLIVRNAVNKALRGGTT